MAGSENQEMFGAPSFFRRARTARAISLALVTTLALSTTTLHAQDTPLPGAVARVSSKSVPTARELAAHVEVRRTTHGVPHIIADNLAAMAYALAYVQCEDYGDRVPLSLLGASGQMGRWFGKDSMDGDFNARLAYRRAVEAYPLLDQDLRDVYEGFAAGVNRYIELHPEEFPEGFAPHFTGYDVLAGDVSVVSPARARRFLVRVDPDLRRRARVTADESEGSETVEAPFGTASAPLAPGEDKPDVGSNAWAFAPSRTKSGHAILLRNPHLNWDAGYYEAHVKVPGKLEFYGDFRIGGPFGVFGGFNRDLGWATTNNAPLLGQIYAFQADTTRVDHYMLDGASVPLQRELVSVEFRNGGALARETREILRTPYGPVIHRGDGKIYVLRFALDNDYRAGEQFLRMMEAKSLKEWKDAMRMGARLSSNFTYADRDGNIFYVWNGAVPRLPLPSGGDTIAIPVSTTADIWTRYIPFDSLPQLLNPKGGYLQNSNDPPYYTNLHQVLDPARYPDYFPEPRLGLRTQLSLQLVDTKKKLSLQDVIALKHSYRMLLADRVRDDLVKLVRASNPSPDVSAAIDVIAKWDKTVAPESRGGTLFESWWRRYTEHTRADTMYAVQWSTDAPPAPPRGIRFPERAVEAFTWAANDTRQRYGSVDVAWGDVHRVRVGDVDVPVGGCSGDIGCFRVLWYKDDPDGKRRVTGGDGWILGVEFGAEPRAVSVLAYGETRREDSPFHADQAAMFARGEVKPVLWSAKDIEANTVNAYRPGEGR
jgi:acyl-homoserine-lactone acylase